MRVCTQCGETKDETEFYLTKKGKPAALCKECAKCRARINYRRHIDRYKAYERSRTMNPERVALRNAYKTTPNGKARLRAGSRAYIERNPLKRSAHVLVGNAIRAGKLIRKPCEVCGSESAQAHHDDYSKPLDVRWLCTIHHAEWHKHNTPLCPDQHQEQVA